MWNKNKTLKVATVFSGIGAPEFALRRLGVKHDVIFACDNGDTKLDLLTPNERLALDGIDSSKDRDKKASEMQSAHVEALWQQIKSLKSKEEKKQLVDSLYASKCRQTNFVYKSYCANYGIEDPDFHQNVQLLDGSDYHGQVDLFIGGSPCQSFTLLGEQKGLEETRGTLFYDFARLVGEIQPKAFIYENVKGLVTHDKGKTWEVVQRVFASLNYKIHFQVLNAEDFGIPQTRRRIFVIGFREDGENFKFPQPQKLKFTMQDFLLENTKDGNVVSQNGDILVTHEKGVVNKKYYLSARVLPGILSEGTGGFKMKPEIDLKIARPLMRTMHKLHRAGEDNYVTTNGKVRRLAPRECLRLMGFTDDFKIAVSDTQMLMQAGNSMVVDVMMKLIDGILNEL